MNNNTNTIFEAIGELDNEILETAFKKKKKKPIALFVIAGAAALSLLIGAAQIQQYRTKVFVDSEWAFDIIAKTHPEAVFLSVEELTEMGVTDIEYDEPQNYLFGDNSKNYTYFINSKPGEIIKKYNLKPLINNNFLEEVTIDDFPEGMEPQGTDVFLHSKDYNKMLPGTKVSVSSDDGHESIQFCYYLIDKQSGIPVSVHATYTTVLRFLFSYDDWFGSVLFTSERGYKIVDLNNGEKAIAGEWGDGRTIILFSYDNTEYMMFTKANVDEAAQILKNFGIVAE